MQKVLTLEKSFDGGCMCLVMYLILCFLTVNSTATKVLAEVFPGLQNINLVHHSKYIDTSCHVIILLQCAMVAGLISMPFK